MASVVFTIVSPSGDETIMNGTITGDGTGLAIFNDTSEIGEYKVAAKFELPNSVFRSVRADFEVIDPFDPPDPTTEQVIARNVWIRLEDCFDSEEGGPWVQDVTMAYFKKEKMPVFISEALFDINQQHPPTDLVVGNFIVDATPNADFPLLVQSTLLMVIRHLIRAYVEQPLPTGAQIAWEDRRDYLERWMQVYELEEDKYLRYLALFKRQFLGLGKTKGLIDSKAGRLVPAPLRTRYVGRGYI